jgi:para-nitrobenzyl esterase
VQANGRKFGADPAAVTILGESAGGQSTCALTVSPAAAGLFHRTVIQSGACTGPWSPGTTSHALNKSATFAAKLGAPTLAAMRKLPVEAIFKDSSSGGFGAGSWAPDDGLVFPDAVRRPIDYYKKGQMNTMEIMIGGNSMDGLGAYFMPKSLPVAAYKSAMQEQWGAEHWSAVAAQYPLEARFFGDTNAAFISPLGDCDVVCSQYQLATIISSQGGHAFVYYFDYVNKLTSNASCSCA